jgi:hypothetical protein
MLAQENKINYRNPTLCVRACVCVCETEREAEKGTGDGGAWDFQYDPKKLFPYEKSVFDPKKSIRKHELR